MICNFVREGQGCMLKPFGNQTMNTTKTIKGERTTEETEIEIGLLECDGEDCILQQNNKLLKQIIDNQVILEEKVN